MNRILLSLILAILPVTSFATGVSELKAFISQTKTAQAHFNQVVLDKAGNAKQQTQGTMAFSRPGKFRWSYDKPYEQLIVGDGSKIYLYDVDLAQVTIKKLDQALGSSPAALLAGNNEIEKFYTLSEAGTHDGLTWLTATPKDKDSSFSQIQMGFSQSNLMEMRIRDNFGLTTQLKLSQLVRNPKLPASTFSFTPPAGVDVISDNK
ncbi:outer membrane lipoprotein chaperone LolA [Sulfuriferula nivalis]|uniref:Outer-membrane lipoprotein carrier protein n=1 Tax=Sulfuriferula nivalis TaxID=2675298 RepID=A0A809S8D4_9PROT|nr:outer membrane lipoprotein chaperone LolA [Sulfuriferula nivalis]BBP00142.1 outer-membrane lipoprotein carrier protein [Sulfuriferula nivalis]